MTKNTKIPIFVIKDSLKQIEAEKKLLAQLLGNIVVHIQAKYRKIGWNMRDPIRFQGGLTMDGQTDGRRTAWHRISSADYVNGGAKMC